MSAATQHHDHGRKPHRPHPKAAPALLIIGLVGGVSAMWLGLCGNWSPADLRFDGLAATAIGSIVLAGLLSRD